MRVGSGTVALLFGVKLGRYAEAINLSLAEEVEERDLGKKTGIDLTFHTVMFPVSEPGQFAGAKPVQIVGESLHLIFERSWRWR